MAELTPREVVTKLDKFIIGQMEAKRAVAIAIRNRWRRMNLPEDLRDEVVPKNIIMIGPTGVGKTEIARRLATLVKAPFLKVEASKYTEVGYHGRDVESMVRDLVDVAVNMVRMEHHASVREKAAEQAEDELLDRLLGEDSGEGAVRESTREKLRSLLHAGKLEHRTVDITIEERASPVQVLGPVNFGEMDVDMQSLFERLIPSKRKERTLSVGEARRILEAQQAERLIDNDKVVSGALERAQTGGIIFLDEIDKIAGAGSEHGPDVSRQGVQRDLLPIVEGCNVATRHGMVRTDHILFFAAGAFHMSKPSDLIPELQGRFPIRVELASLGKEEFVRILTEPTNALVTQYKGLLATEQVQLDITDDAIEALAEIAEKANRRIQNIGARRLHTVMDKVLEDISFDAPDLIGKVIKVDGAYVRERLESIVKDEDLSKYIL